MAEHFKVINGENNKMVKDHTKLSLLDVRGKKIPAAVALVKECVKHYRTKNIRPIKTIYLKKELYEIVLDWTRACAEFTEPLGNKTGGEEQADLLSGKNSRENALTFDGVFVMEASILSPENITWDFYDEPNRGKA